MNLLILPRPANASQRTITLAFVHPGPDDPFMNRFVANVSKHKLCHVELHFESVNQAFSIRW